MKKRILVIEDDENTLNYLVSLFKNNGYATSIAKNGKEGIDVVKEKEPDLITLDLEMPGEWGPRFYRRLIRDPELKNIPVIVISGLSGSGYAIPKAVASIKKPFDRNKLLEIIEETIGK